MKKDGTSQTLIVFFDVSNLSEAEFHKLFDAVCMVNPDGIATPRKYNLIDASIYATGRALDPFIDELCGNKEASDGKSDPPTT